MIVRPGVVYGPGNKGITGRVGLGTFGLFLHLGGSNEIPLTYVDNCADAIVLAGIKGGVDGEVFNVVDDDLPTSRKFLRLYKKNVRPLPFGLRAPWTGLPAVLCVGEIFRLVERPVAAGVQQENVWILLEREPVHQREAEKAPRLESPGSLPGSVRRYFEYQMEAGAKK